MSKIGAPRGPRDRVADTHAATSLDEATRKLDHQRYVLRLYVSGATLRSRRAIERVRTLCEGRLHRRYELEVIDIYQVPALAAGEQIIATPTLIRLLPTPLRRYVGDLTRIEKVLFGLDLQERP